MVARRLSVILPFLGLAVAAGCGQNTSPTPKISDVKVTSTSKNSLSISFTLEFKSGADSGKAGKGYPSKVFVGIGPPDQIAKMVDFLNEKGFSGGNLRGEGSVASCSD